MGARSFQYAMLAVFLATACAAQVAIDGKVVDENNVPVAAAEVTIKSAADVRFRTATDPTGAFRIQLTQPGPYLISVEHVDLFSLIDRPIDLHSGANEMMLTMAHVRNTSESVNVSDRPSPVDVERTDAERRLNGPEIFAIPYPATHDLRNALPLMPGVLKGPANDLHFDGGTERQTEYMLDGFNISDPLTGTFRTHFSVEAVRSLDSPSGRFSPEIGKGSTGALAIHTESGDDTWRYSGTNFIPGIDTGHGTRVGAYTPRLNFSGPLVKGKAWLSDSIDANYNQLYVPGLPSGQNTRYSYGASNLLHVQANLTPTNVLYANFLGNVDITPNSGLGVLDPIQTTVDLRDREWFFSVRDQLYLTRGTLLEYGFADFRTFYRMIPQGHSFFQFTPNGRLGNNYVDSTEKSQRKQFLANLYLPSFQWKGSHQLKAGTDVDRLDYSQDVRRTGFNDIGLTGTILRQVVFGGSGALERPSLEVSSYVLDNWKIKPNLVVQAGIRQDWDELVRSISFSPRMAFSYAPLGWKNTKLSGGYAIIYDADVPQLFSRPQDQYSLTTLYHPDGSVLNGPSVTAFTVGHNLSMSRYQNLSFGLEQLLPARILLGVNLLTRRGHNGLSFVNILNPNAPPPSEFVSIYHSTQFAGIYQLANVRHDQYDSAEIRVHQPFGKGYEWFASYTRSRAASNEVVDITVSQPTAITDNIGRLPWDSPNRFLTWGYLPTPFQNWAVAYLFEDRTGFPFSAVDQIGQVVGSPNSLRFPNYLNLNLHIEWTTHLFGYRFALRGGLNNITNHANWTVVNNTIGSPQFLNFYGSDGRHFVARIRFLGKM